MATGLPDSSAVPPGRRASSRASESAERPPGAADAGDPRPARAHTAGWVVASRLATRGPCLSRARYIDGTGRRSGATDCSTGGDPARRLGTPSSGHANSRARGSCCAYRHTEDAIADVVVMGGRLTARSPDRRECHHRLHRPRALMGAADRHRSNNAATFSDFATVCHCCRRGPPARPNQTS